MTAGGPLKSTDVDEEAEAARREELSFFFNPIKIPWLLSVFSGALVVGSGAGFALCTHRFHKYRADLNDAMYIQQLRARQARASEAAAARHMSEMGPTQLHVPKRPSSTPS